MPRCDRIPREAIEAHPGAQEALAKVARIFVEAARRQARERAAAERTNPGEAAGLQAGGSPS